MIFKMIFVGANATMSMPATCEKPVWAMLDWRCGLDEGRTAIIPETGLLVSSFKVMSEGSGKEHQIKTIVSGATCVPLVVDEDIVLSVVEKRQEGSKTLYKTLFASGEHRWLLARDFIDDDGTVNDQWLTFVDLNDLREAFSSFTEAKLKVCTNAFILYIFTIH